MSAVMKNSANHNIAIPSKILSFSCLLFLLFFAVPVAFAGTAVSMSSEIASTINQARARLSPGLPPLVVNNNLSLAAHEIAAGNTSPLMDIIHKRGDIVVRADASRGSLYFSNFRKADDSVHSILQELIDRDRAAQSSNRSLLHPLNTDFGFDLAPISRRLGNHMVNGYRLTVVVAESAYSATDLGFLQLINQGRRTPLTVAASLGLDISTIKKDFAGDPDTLTHGLPPLTMNADILTISNKRSSDILQAGQNTPNRLDSKAITALLSREGYRTAAKKRVKPCDLFASLTFPANLMAPGPFSSFLFGSYFKDELMAADPGEYCFLQAGITEAGITTLNGETFLGNEESPSWTTMQSVGLFSAPKQAGLPYISGLVYRDSNKNHLYDLGEGVHAARVNITGIGNGYSLQLYTDPAGGFALPLPSGKYQIRVVSASVTKYSRVTVSKENTGVIFKL